MHCDKFSLMCFVAMMCVCTGLSVLDGIHRWGVEGVHASIAVGAGLVCETANSR